MIPLTMATALAASPMVTRGTSDATSRVEIWRLLGLTATDASVTGAAALAVAAISAVSSLTATLPTSL